MKNKHLFIPLFVFLGAGVVSLIASIIDFKAVNKQLAYSSETIQFNYDGASDGKDPNGNAFNAVDFLTDDIIQKGLTASEVDLEVKQVRAYLTISNVVPKNIVSEIDSYTSIVEVDSNTGTITSKDYHPVRYRFSLYSDIGLSASKTNDLLKNIVDTYVSEFYKTYASNFDKSVYDDIYTLDDYDYIYQTQVFTNKLEILMNYAKEIYDKKVEFTASLENSGRTYTFSFDDLYQRCKNLIENDTTTIHNLITLKALSKDLDRIRDYYDYKIQRLNYTKNQLQADLDAVTAQINAYVKDSTIYVSDASGMVEVSSQSSATYNALVNAKIEISNQLANVTTDIAKYTAVLENIDAPISTPEDYDLIRLYLRELGEDYEQVEDVFVALLQAFNNTYMSDKLVTTSAIKYSSGSLFSSAFIVRCIKIAAPIMLTVMLGIAIFYLSREIRKQKKAA